MTLEEFIRSLVEQILPTLASGATSWTTIGFFLGFAAGLALYGVLHLLGVWRSTHSFMAFMRPVSALTLGLLIGAGCSVVLGAVGVQRGASDALTHRPELQQVIYPLTATIITTSEALAAAGPLHEQGLADDDLRAALERHLSAVQARGYVLQMAEVPATAQAAQTFIHAKNSRLAKPSIIQAVTATVPSSGADFVTIVIDGAYDMGQRNNAQLGSLLEDSYETLSNAAARDGTPEELTPEELGEHLIVSLLAPMMLIPLGYMLAGLVVTVLLVVGFGALLVPVSFTVLKWLLERTPSE